ncbi:MAG: molybdate ABC transporter substrate-binding protein [Oligoflexia bacterium]|nr:molybdate ABC transporter substrate-binding protein [Oligoflexia bacterium]MBF0364716.1 molybdate ABC transporter substrate-binding protein [Oligoflexia bacterium]
MFIVFFMLCLLSSSAYAEKITIAAAADLKYAMDKIVKVFKKNHPLEDLEVIFGSSGKIFAQIQQGAPYDLYFAADISYPQELSKNGFASSDVKLYAIGKIVLWSTTHNASKMTLTDLKDTKIKHIAIANPKHAPYGKRAQEALEATKVWNDIKSKIVYGDNIVQTAQFVQSGNADIGIIALSIAMNPELSNQGAHWPIPDNLHKPLEQAYIITKRAANNKLARKFADFMETTPAREIMIKYGFVLPKERDQTKNPGKK